ncbi:MAG: 30S ribosomal protein S2 [Candidatus Omnitrophica bacterium CG07_land_8_20_14_0_80_42_15]|uniref:Small ribosomal subunit protein uS2 n=1 Tax=Candidatus Aquitaenariimonas noxiae TaxID=1974741 RepID=A0A2J0KVQ0_9BACT|nr:MAG: 30S ribosomal protein S2 [Candidatus Omnitrophica bacterium CG07_land_8_20_14_0_80_42_15]
MKQLLEAGVHFGHQTNRWNPKMSKYIFGEKNGIYIVDLQKTLEGIRKATSLIKSVASRGEYILIVGTKKQAKAIVRDHAVRCGMPYVVERWLGGTLTNFMTIRKSVKRLEELESLKASGTYALLTKKEQAQIAKELEKLLKNLEGIRNMLRLPGAVFVIDSKNEDIAVKEANRLLIPVVGLVDTNSDPDRVDCVVPGNDDAMKSIELISRVIADSAIEGRQQFLKGRKEADDKKEAAFVKADDVEIEKLIGEGTVKDDATKEERIKKKPAKKKTKTQ